MSGDNDVPGGDVLKTYRAANALLQEQASPATRAAILAAAACAGAARPAPGSSRLMRSPTAKAGWRSWLFSHNTLGRLPVAAAATALVSVVAWQIAHFAPGLEDSFHSAAPPAPASAPAQTAEAARGTDGTSRAELASNDSAHERAAQDSPRGGAKSAGGATPVTPTVPSTSSVADARATTTTRAPAIVAEAARPSPVEHPSTLAGAHEADAAPSAAPSAEAATARILTSPKSEATTDQVNQASRLQRPKESGPEVGEGSARVSGNLANGAPARPGALASNATRMRAEPVERSGPVAGDTAAAASSAPLDLDRWVARIVQLRRAGRDAEADAELKQLRLRYPDTKLPPAVERNAIGTQ